MSLPTSRVLFATFVKNDTWVDPTVAGHLEVADMSTQAFHPTRATVTWRRRNAQTTPTTLLSEPCLRVMVTTIDEQTPDYISYEIRVRTQATSKSVKLEAKKGPPS